MAYLLGPKEEQHTAVSTKDAIKYGFHLILYALIVVVVGLVPALLGAAVIQSGDGGSWGILLMGLGGLILYAGSIGIFYKVIADGVKAGIQAK